MTPKEALEKLKENYIRMIELSFSDGNKILPLEENLFYIIKTALYRLEELEKVLNTIKKNCKCEFNERFVNNKVFLYEVIINGFLSIQLSNKEDFDLLKEVLK